MPWKPRARAALIALGLAAASTALLRALTTGHSPPFDALPWIAASISFGAVVWARCLTDVPQDKPASTEHHGLAWLTGGALLGALSLGLLYGPALALPFLNEEDLFHLAIVRWPDRFGLGTALLEAMDYLRSHPATIIQCLVFVPWYAMDALSGDSPIGYRVLSIVLHGSMAVLTARTARLLGLDRRAAVVAGLLTLVAAVSRPVVRDPTGLPELLAGVLYLGLLGPWVSRLENRHASRGATVLAFALLPVAVVTKPILASLPIVVLAVVLLRGKYAQKARPGRLFVRALPLFAIAVVQIALVAWQFRIDPSSGRQHASHPTAEYGLVAQGSKPLELAEAVLANLPRTLTLPAWDWAPQAHWSGAAAVGLAVFALLGLGTGRRGLGPVTSAAVLTLGSALPGIAFTGNEGPVNAHLLYVATAGSAIAAVAWTASLPPRRAAFATALLIAGCGVAFALHVEEMSRERIEARLLDEGQTDFDTLDDTFEIGQRVRLVSGTDGATNRWRRLVLSRYARDEGPRAAYLIETDVEWLVRPSGEQTTHPGPPTSTSAATLAWVHGRVRRLDGTTLLPDDLPSRVVASSSPVCEHGPLLELGKAGTLCRGPDPMPLHPVEELLAEM